MKNFKIEYKCFKISDNIEKYEVKNPNIIFDIVKNKFNPFQEEMDLFILNTKNNILKQKTISIGNSNAMLITPAEIFRYILLDGGNRFIITHNHPSLNLNVSKEDIDFTKKLLQCSKMMELNFLDHLVYTNKKYVSLKEKGYL